MPRVCIVGLDCLTPQLAFDRFTDAMPNLQALMRQGAWGPLESCMPPITVPAWACMTTGHDPGQLGLYGYKTHQAPVYETQPLPSSLSFPQPPLWTLLSRAGKRCLVLGVPLTYPPKPLRGLLVCGAPTPPDAPFTYPPEFGASLEARFGRFLFDATHHRGDDLDALVAEVKAMTEQRFAIAKTWLRNEPWDFFMMVDMGPDRLHHALWHTIAPDHPHFDPHHRLSHVIRDHYRRLDEHLGEVRGLLRSDDVLLVVSDHGAQTLRARFALNQWLSERGYLSLRAAATSPCPIDRANVDWSRTQAWAEGGYVGRIYLNIMGRHPCGTVAESAKGPLCARLTAELMAGAAEENVVARCYRPTALYRQTRGLPPDLTVVLDDFATLAEGALGHPRLLFQGSEVPDGASHARHGVFVASTLLPHPTANLSLFDIAPTVLTILGVPVPSTMVGRNLYW